MAADPTPPQEEPASDQIQRIDRRRPGRRDDVSPELIPLLRGDVSVDDDPVGLKQNQELVFRRGLYRNDSDPILGLAAAIVLSGALWIGLLLSVRLIYAAFFGSPHRPS